ncbi:MAG TPA: hypothetical protein IAC31_09905 [Candidatus Faecousia intestinigallinarum]|nr:hypothetical protein [Candidatus Faecousia intestinigallinarum]
MKTNFQHTSRHVAYRRGAAIPFPGAARRRVLDKLLDAALAIALAAGAAATILFLLIL